MGRMDFATMLKNERNNAKTLTENGAIAYETSGKHLLDFNFKLSQYRNMTVNQIKDDFAKVFFEDPLIATKFVFYIGDVRGGLGERKIFNACIEWLADNKKDIALAILWAVPEYTRWDNLCKLATNKNVGHEVINIINDTLVNDFNNMHNNKPITLLAKWMPSINASSKETVELAKSICYRLRVTPRDYRKTLSALRKYLDIVEVKISANEWNDINYSAVPSQANLRYNSAFLRHDESRRRAFLESLRKGETKINASVAQPHEIVRNYLANNNYYWRTDIKKYDEALEQMWKSLPNIAVEDSLVVRDGSGSMTCSCGSGKTSCLDVATALAIYCAEHNSDNWKDKFITFSSHPEFIDLSNCHTLRDKLVRCYAENDCSNTDIMATMRLILKTAIKNHCTQDEMPKNIIIVSDMQFDSGSRYHSFNWDKTLFEVISDEYKTHGYLLPKIIFWNVSARNFSTIPMQNNELGLILCSGFSTTNMKMFMSGEVNPYKILLEQINTERYKPIEESIKQLI